MNYVLISDANCDLPQEQVDKFGLKIIPMGFSMEDVSYNHYPDAREMSLDKFYTKLKIGILSQTTQINYNDFVDFFEPFLKDEKDILYICFTSGLSGTYNTCLIAVNDLLEKYPERKIIVVDSSCASVGQGLLVYHVAKKYAENVLSIAELAKFAEITKEKCCHWFVVDDLDQLKRGGRISAVTATFGKALQIKPLLSVDKNGKLVTVGKIRGTSKTYDTLIEKLKRDGENYCNQTILIGHADAKESALELKERVAPLVKEVIICDIGPVIGTHVGAGMIALTFLGNRNIT